eukprot:6138929-Pyramimonas_sp.AAC.1
MGALGSQGWGYCGRFLVDWPPLYRVVSDSCTAVLLSSDRFVLARAAVTLGHGSLPRSPPQPSA